jgi:hypothetical protein
MKSVGRVFVVTILVLAGAGVVGLAASKAGLLDPAWSLESRVAGHFDARVAGDREAARAFISPEASKRTIGNAIQLLSYEIESITIEDDKATVNVEIEFKLAVPGFTTENDRPRKERLVQAWVRDGFTWYWMPVALEGGDTPVWHSVDSGPKGAADTAGQAPSGAVQDDQP